MLFPIGVLVAAAGATHRQMTALGLLFLAVFGPLFFRGFRGPVILNATALIAVWGTKDRPTARRVGIVFAVIAMSLVPVIRVARDIDSQVAPTIGKIDPVAVVLEAGGSMWPLVITAERIESGAEALWLGRSYRQGAEHMLLNVSSRRSAHDTTDLYPNAWATQLADPWLFEQGGGIGFSAVAEPYLNFGVAGVVVFFLLLGLFIGSCERWLMRDPFRAAVGAAMFGFISWCVRDDSVQLPRAAMLACATVLAAWLATRLRRERHAARTPFESNVDGSEA
jgi:oligosaccharide repeat unit polymerase